METKEYRNKTVISDKFKSTINNNSNIAEIEKEGFDGDNNFIDYFMIIGAKPEIFKNSYLYNSSLADINSNLIPQIITKFPKIDKKHIVIESTIPQQIFPQGFNVVESATKPENQFYFVILDNQLYSATYTNKYIACLLIYESIKDYEILNEKYKQTDILFNTMRSNSIKTQKPSQSDKYINYYIPKCLCLVSVYPAFSRFHEILTSIYNLVNSNNQLSNLYIDRVIEKLVLEIPKLPRGLKKIFLNLPPNTVVDLTEKKMNDLPKININLSHFFSSLDIGNIIEIFRYLLLETKLIFFGSKLYDLTNSILSILSLIYPFKYQFQIVSVLPKDLYNFIETISPYIFGVNETYDENFFNKNQISLEDATICIIDLDRNKYHIKTKNDKELNKDFPPFPKNLKEKIEKGYNKFKKEINANKSKEIKDLNAKIDEENSEYRLIFFNFMISLLKDYPKFLTKDYGVTKDISMSIKDMIDLTSYANSYSANERDFYSRLFSTQMFMEFIYKRMMPKNYYEKVDILFFEEKISEIKLKKSFFKSKEGTPYLLINSHEYDFDNKDVIIDCATEIGVTKKVYEYIIQNRDEAEKLFLNNGYDIDIDEEKQTVKFNYHIFPCLLSEKFFALNYEYYQKPELYHNAINEINLKIVNKSNLQFNPKNKEPLTEEGNDIYLCYLIIWSLTLWYTDELERESRFLQMIDVVERIQFHDIQIFELLFKTLVDIKWSDKDIILLYKKFIHLNLNPTWKIFSIVSKIIKKKTNVKNKKALLSQETKFATLKVKSKTKKKSLNQGEYITYRKRTLKTKIVDDRILSEDVLFFAFGKCPTCDKNINLINLCSNLTQLKTKSKPLKNFKKIYKSLNTQIIKHNFSLDNDEDKDNKNGNGDQDTFKCPNKHLKEDSSDYIKFNLKIIHGVELFNSNMKSTEDSTSNTFTIPLMSPPSIKNELLKLSKILEDEQRTFDVENFKLNNNILFWNIIWYLQLNGMDISFMLPYSGDITSKEKQNLENLKKFINTKYKPEKDINIEKIVHNNELNIDFLFCKNRDSLEGQNINEIEIKNELFNQIKSKYEQYDLIEQKIFKFQINPNKGFISYMRFNDYSENIGYNEYPSQYKEIPDITINYSASPKIISSNNSLDIVDIKPNSCQELIQTKLVSINNDDSNDINKNLNRLKTENLENKEKKNLLIRSKFSKENKGLLKKPANPKIDKENEENININNELLINNESKENENENEEIDILAQFKENQKKMEKNEIVDYKSEIISDKSKVNFLRRSTLNEGILDEENNENNE